MSKRPPSIIQNDKTPFFMMPDQGAYDDLHPHEPIGGCRRLLSIQEGLYIYVPGQTHHWLHEDDEGVKKNKEFKALMQRKWLDHQIDTENLTEEEAWDKWWRIFGKNYIE